MSLLEKQLSVWKPKRKERYGKGINQSQQSKQIIDKYAYFVIALKPHQLKDLFLLK